MELNSLFGLPAHPLLVHVPVVLVPLAVLVTIVALWPRVRRVAALAAAVLALAGGIGVVLATGSGEQLEEQVQGTDRVEEHAEQGEAAEAPALIFGGVAVAAAALNEVVRRRGRSSVDEPSRAPAGAPPREPARALAGARTGATGGTPTWESSGAPARQPVGGPNRSTSRAPAGTRPRTVGRWLAAGALAVSMVAGAVATTAVVRAGHSGADAVWHDTNDTNRGPSGRDGDEGEAVRP
jgi:hypothetical protein